MSLQAEVAVQAAVEHLLARWEEAQQQAALMGQFSQFNTAQLLRLNYELIHTGLMPQPVKDQVAFECAQPEQTELDLWATNRISQSQLEGVSPDRSLSSELLTEETEPVPGAGIKSKQQVMEELAQKDAGVFALSEPKPTPEEAELERRIGEVKRSLYARMKAKKELEEEERRREEELRNRKAPEAPKQEFAFDYNGGLFMRRKSMMRTNLALLVNSRSEEPSEKSREKAAEEDSFRYCLESRGGGSREAKRLVFNNAGKRQRSHLPFIKLTESNKLSENNRVMCSDPSKYTLKSVQSRGDCSFRHHAEIEKERSERVHSLRRSEVSWSEESSWQEDIKQNEAAHPHSKRMQKYLRRICEDRTKDVLTRLNRSSNFEVTNSTHEPPLSRYYRHNYDDDKSNICESSLVSLRLHRGRGHFTQATQLTQVE